MISIMIVDDDYLVRSYLKSLDIWSKSGFEIICEARDGEEAINKIEQNNTDVIITDIAMPILDGIDLIRKVREINNNVYIMVLSCFDDFKSVKEAMKVGANEYILKNNINEKVLKDILINIKIYINELKLKKEKEEKNKKLIQIGVSKLKYEYFHKILMLNIPEKEKKRLKEEAGIIGKYNNSCIISLFKKKWINWKEDKTKIDINQYENGFLFKLVSCLRMKLGSINNCIEVIYMGEGCFKCFIDLSSMYKDTEIRSRIATIVSICYEYCKIDGYWIAVSNVCIGKQSVEHANEQIEVIKKLKFYSNDDILYYDLHESTSYADLKIVDKLIYEIDIYKQYKNSKDFKKNFVQCIEQYKFFKIDKIKVISWIKEIDKKIGIQRNFNYYSKFENIDEIFMLQEEYEEHLVNDNNYISDDITQCMIMAVDYIKKMYKQPIGLQEIAEYMHLNPTYFSYRFKQEMKMGFSKYLLDYRINIAKELLKNTTLKVKDISIEAGFSDYKHFTKTFKKLNNCTPIEFRNKK